MINKYFLPLILVLIAGCDRPGILELKNSCNDPVTFTYSFSADYQYMDIPSTTVSAGETGRIFFGFGTQWTDLFLKNYAEKVVDTIHLEVGLDSYYCSNNTCKKGIFDRVNRKSKRRLVIDIDSTLIQRSFTKQK